MTTISDLGEFGLIQRIARNVSRDPGVHAGIGDDCAVLPTGNPERFLLVTTDPVIEGTHFDLNAAPYQIGWKAMARNLSDIAACGGQPRWAVVSAGLRADMTTEFVDEMYRGMNAAATQFGAHIVGGDTTRVTGKFFLAVTMLGEVERSHLKLRSTARPGDSILVTGTLGGSIAGRHLEFTPRVREARWLVERFPIHALIDLSDGLAGDLFHILEQSDVGARIVAPRIPVSETARHLESEGEREHSSLDMALYDGEDFELLFTIPSRHVEELLVEWPKHFQLPLQSIGTIAEGPVRLILVDEHGEEVNLPPKGYDHFRKPQN
ncbi:MAG: thiamine-monophosphate kinase [Verrucomicrobiae bacterium]|nr:thiamine-monophosphate kinase [Verrucomicrobiae bacterium]